MKHIIRAAAAPWSDGLKLISLAVTVGIVGGELWGATQFRLPASAIRYEVIGAALIAPLVLIVCITAIVREFVIDHGVLQVRRPFWSTRIPLDGLQHAWVEEAPLKGALRVGGIGGLFSYSGFYQSRRLGRFRLFATTTRNAVVLMLPARVIVITPVAPHAFVEELRSIFPGLNGGPAPAAK